MDSCSNHCIVTFMDLAGTRSIIDANSASAVETMREFHQVVYGESTSNMPTHEHAYTWNDSVLLIAYTDSQFSNIDATMREADNLKKRIDLVKKCYAISVKGMSFSDPCYYSGHVFEGANIEQPKFVYLKASSYAFTNCYEIEKKLGKKHKKDWYIDERIATKIKPIQQAEKIEEFEMLPGKEKRNIHMYSGYLW